MQSKYSSVFSRFLKRNDSSTKGQNSNSGQPKVQKDRLMLRIFGSENNYKMIKSIVSNNGEPQDAYDSHSKPNSIGNFSHKQMQNKMKSNIENNSPKSIDVNSSSKQLTKDKDIDVKLEKALLDLSEHK